MKKAFLFDLDGVITETSHQHYIAWKELANELGIEIDLEFNEQLKGVSRVDSLNRILERGNALGKYSQEELNKFLEQKNDHYKELIKDLKPEDAFPGTHDLFRELKEKGLKIVICSASFNAPTILKALDLEQYVDYIVNPGEIAKGKPAPDIFLRGAEKFGLSIDECVGVEDAQSGIKAIKDAGMLAIGIGDKDVLKDSDINLNGIGEIVVDDIING